MPRLAFPHDHTPQRSQRDIDGSKIPINDLRFFVDRAAKKWPLRGSLKLG
jgi:hypothetical protein